MKKLMTVRITKNGPTFGMTGPAVWDANIGKWEVSFRSPWVGSYAADEVVVIK